MGPGRVVFANDDLASLFGQDAPQLIGQDLVRFVEQPQRPAARKALRQATRTGRVSAASWRVRGIGPRPFEISLQPRPLAGLDGDQLYVIVAKGKQQQRNDSVQRQALLASIAEECDEAIIGIGPGEAIEILEPRRGRAVRLGGKRGIGCPDVNTGPAGPPDRGG